MANLVLNLAANGASAAVPVSGVCVLGSSGDSVYADAKLELQISTNGSGVTLFRPAGHTFEEGSPPKRINVPGSYHLRVVASGVTSTTDITIPIQQ